MSSWLERGKNFHSHFTTKHNGDKHKQREFGGCTFGVWRIERKRADKISLRELESFRVCSGERSRIPNMWFLCSCALCKCKPQLHSRAHTHAVKDTWMKLKVKGIRVGGRVCSGWWKIAWIRLILDESCRGPLYIHGGVGRLLGGMSGLWMLTKTNMWKTEGRVALITPASNCRRVRYLGCSPPREMGGG